MNLSRRGLFAGTGLAALLAGCGSTDEATGTTGSTRSPSSSPAATSQRFRYGQGEAQYADLRMPSGSPLGTVVLLHGGYWLPQYPAAQMIPMAKTLTALGFATWNVEYRRSGATGSYRETLTDVAAAVDLLAGSGVPEGLDRNVVLLGHSAGGHLAVWAASRRESTPGGASAVEPVGAISLSGVLDLTSAALDPRSSGPVQAFMGGPPQEHPESYAEADPALLAPASCPVWAVHAESDGVVPIEQSSGYVEKATAAGGTATFSTVPGDHTSIIDPGADSFPVVRRLVIDAVP